MYNYNVIYGIAMKLNIKTIFLTLAIAICALFIIRGIAILTEGENGRLKRTIYKAKRLTERENILALVDHISPDYSDELGNDRRSLLLIAKSFFDDYRNILILIDVLEIEIEEKNAIAHIEATVYWQGNISSDITYDTVKVKASFRKKRNRWKLTELQFLEPEKKRLFNPMIG